MFIFVSQSSLLSSSKSTKDEAGDEAMEEEALLIDKGWDAGLRDIITERLSCL